ncbi:MAG TPA: 2'-5' RNA ligase family protein [Nocardioides sp.]|uniref:2'-5' RNA ligase family protein n=1 Tax=Nocardioides sp. TaxID=35761 RepID=UPI002C4F5E7F|nr:2'-5' RNA ligase family protein [Nocardioides sp.]HQR28182.1 2'-5' RNA ligase family protein [Nocardioides sp.]
MPTIGVALAIPEPWGQQLQDYRTSVGEATAALIPAHITLVPPVDVPEAELEEIQDHLAHVALTVPRFQVQLRGTGTFRPVSPVVFVAVAAGGDGCEQLADALRRGPLGVELQFPYHPHVTIAHHLPDEALDRALAELADFRCSFDATAFHLYAHDAADGWKPTRDFVLGAPVD